MILEVMSFGFFLTAVRSAITSAQYCMYTTSFDITCSGAATCQDLCDEMDCDQLSCDMLSFFVPGMPSASTCFSANVDTKVECEDDGAFASCDDDGVDICQRMCTSSNGQCENCLDMPVDMSQFNLAGLECAVYHSQGPNFFANYQNFCECFTHTNEDGDSNDMMIGCKGSCSVDSESGAGSGSDDDSVVSDNDDDASAVSDNDDDASAVSDNDDDASAVSDNDDDASAVSDNDDDASAVSDNDDDASAGSDNDDDAVGSSSDSSAGADNDDASAVSDNNDASAGSDNDDDSIACDGDDVDLCRTVCTTTDGQCGNGCTDMLLDMAELNLAGLDCDDYRSKAPLFLENFSDFCECFTHTDDDGSSFDMMIGCKEACGPDGAGSGSSSGSDNTVLIVGIIAGAVVLIAIIIAVTICTKRKKL